VTIALPVGWHVESVPPGRASDLKVLMYAIAARDETQSLRLTRDLNIGLYAATADSYPAIRSFFEKVRTARQGARQDCGSGALSYPTRPAVSAFEVIPASKTWPAAVCQALAASLPPLRKGSLC
jgi:hypothetical protein